MKTLALFLFALASHQVAAATGVYDLNRKCFALQNTSDNSFISGLSGSRLLKQVDFPDTGISFILKASALGEYLLMDQEGRYLTVDSDKLRLMTKPSYAGIFKIKNHDEGLEIVHKRSGKSLLAGQERPLLDVRNKSKQTSFFYRLIPRDNCAAFPEAELNAIGTPEEQNEDLTGFVDLHTHLAFPKTMGALSMSGGVFHPLGITKALGSCSELHGDKGEKDLLGGQTGSNGHVTDGYPNFTEWPNRSTYTHVTAYYRWLQRAYLSGLRIAVTHVTGNPTLCQLLAILHPGKSEGHCDGIGDTKAQVKYIRDLEAYVDAQEGGPGKGWFRIVTSAGEARKAVSQNKLAVVLGVEHSELFNCTESNRSCNEAYIDRELNKLHALGVRSVFPIHRFDNAFGGALPQGGSNGAWMNIASRFNTSNLRHPLEFLRPENLFRKKIPGHFWELEKCPEGVEGVSELQNMDEFVNKTLKPLIGNVLKLPVIGPVISKILSRGLLDKLGPYPTYSEYQSKGSHGCNKRGLTPKGRYLLEKMIAKKMIIEVDHLSYKAMRSALEILSAHNYSGFVSGHGWIELQQPVKETFYRLGGMLGVGMTSPAEFAQRLEGQLQERGAFTGIGLGSDIQGVADQASSDQYAQIQYPFKSYDGSVEFQRPQTGNRIFDYQKEGLAHYGLLPEWIENLRQSEEQLGVSVLPGLMGSAKAYIEMWERAEASGK